MKTSHFIFAVALFFNIHAPAQNKTLEILQLALRTQTVSYSQPEVHANMKCIRIVGKYNSAHVEKILLPTKEFEIIESVTLVYSKPQATFDQEKLNLERLDVLYNIFPAAFKSPFTVFRFVEQTGSGVDHSNLFHGFDIVYRATATPESMQAEVLSLKKMVLGEFVETTDITIKPNAEVMYVDDAKGNTIAVRKTIATEEPMNVEFLPRYDSEILETKGAILGPVVFNDDVVKNTFNRHPEWSDMLVVCDVTGSMFPYTAQLFAWYKLHALENKVRNFIFFNDGDWKPDASKITGATGGIYDVRAASFDTVMRIATKAMISGGGGDCPENNVEALIAGLKKYPNSKEIILIADNWATPRDMELMLDIGRPVKIILCGAMFGINTAYLDLARATGGSVHLMEEELTDLAKIHEGETISIGRFNYKLVAGKFIRL
ncbi:MAG: hypothetical protein ACRCYO_17670 [Bacteroidia bacterium]